MNKYIYSRLFKIVFLFTNVKFLDANANLKIYKIKIKTII